MATFTTDDDMQLTASFQRAVEAAQSRNFESAEKILRKIIAQSPAFTSAQMLLVNCLELQSRLRDAISVASEASRREPDSRALAHYLARLETLVGDHDKAIATYEALLARDDSDLTAWILLAQLYRTVARKRDSVNAFREALARDAGNGAAWWSIANYFPAEIDESDERHIQDALRVRNGDPHEAGPLHIALGLAAERRGDFAEAFSHISAGKHLRRAVTDYNPEWVTTEVDGNVARLPAERLAAPEGSPKATSGPVFLVGMPRSGSTLLENILGRHSAIEAAGELPLINGVVERVRQRCAGRGDFQSVLSSFSADELGELGKWYLDRASDYRRSDKPLFIDKWNSNWLHAGLIRLILPEAPIIDLRRDALDCCWSNFKMLFGSGLGFSNELSDLGRFYCDYVRQMDWIRALAPGRVHYISYEAMVEDVEVTTRKSLDFLGLEYEPGCVDSRGSSAPIATPSSEQVRQPVNRSGIASAEPYRPWLQPLIDALASCGANER